MNGPRGMAISFRRYATSKERLDVQWRLPVYAPDLDAKREAGKTYGTAARVALPREKAFVELGAPDHRPLLVMRECDKCKGTDHALLSRRLDNDKTVLLTHWFHCVKMPNHVLEEDHPFRNLFTEKHPPHLFLCKHDGTGVISLDGNQSQTELWKAMTKLLKESYTGDSKRTVRELLKILNEFDICDQMKLELEERFEKELLKNGAKSRKLKSLKQKLAKVEKRRQRALARERDLRDLGLKPLPKSAQATPGG